MTNGVCLVEGVDKAEALELMGYAHGRDRGMQTLMMMRIFGQGRGAELLDAGDESGNRHFLQEDELVGRRLDGDVKIVSRDQ